MWIFDPFLESAVTKEKAPRFYSQGLNLSGAEGQNRTAPNHVISGPNLLSTWPHAAS
jgi:hypothetical protein